MKKIVVIFRAIDRQKDEEYSVLSVKLERMALEEYGCLEYLSINHGDENITLSYWPSEEHARKFKQQADHLRAQHMGREKWYEHYSVQIAEIVREYDFDAVS